MTNQKRKVTPFKTTKIFDANWRATADYVINEGGTSSSKTYSLCQVLLLKAALSKKLISIVGQDMPNLKRGAIRDCANILSGSEWVQSQVQRWNRSEQKIYFRSGSVIEFVSFDNEQDARSGKRDIAFFNEANGIPYEVFSAIASRTNDQVYLDYNPSALFWVHSKLIGKYQYTLIRSTYKNNPYISERVLRQIMSWQPTEENIKRGTDNANKWRVFGLGLPGANEGQVYTNYKIVEAMPKETKWQLVGLDFGFTNDPTAAVLVALSGGELWVQELIYQTGLMNEDIAEQLKGFKLVVADSAEPKSIEAIRRKRVNIHGAIKGADSVRSGVNLIRSYPLNIVRGSHNLIRELENYLYTKDRHGDYTNKPADSWNHALDALRYAVSFKELRKTNRVRSIA